MERRLLNTLVVLSLPLCSAGAQQRAQQPPAQQPAMMMMEFDTRATKWNDIDVPGFPTGLKIAPVHGNPDKAGELYTLRLRFPDGYAFPAHWHPMAENVTVIAGTIYLGMGDKAMEGAAKRYIAGDFLHIPGKMPHFGHVRGETVIQLHGTGPFQIILASAATMK